MVRTYGLRKNVEPNLPLVQDTLAQNFDILQGVAQSMVNVVTGQLNTNAQRLGATEKRILNSINGHLRRNNQLLGPIIQFLTAAVQNGIQGIQASVNMIAARPDVQQWLAANPPPSPWASVVPMPPPPGSLNGTAPEDAIVVPAKAICPPGLWIVLVHCSTRQAAAIPDLSQDALALLVHDGWVREEPEVCHPFRDPNAAMAYLREHEEQLMQQCG